MAGKGDNFLKYYSKYKDKIYNYFFYRLNFNQSLSDDLVSEVFLKALKNFSNYNPEFSFQAWIYKISENHLINYYKIAKREISIDYAENIATNQTKNVELGHDLELIFKEINTFDAYNKEVLLLRFVDGLTNREIADHLEKDEGAVRTQMSRALKTLRNKLKDKQ